VARRAPPSFFCDLENPWSGSRSLPHRTNADDALHAHAQNPLNCSIFDARGASLRRALLRVQQSVFHDAARNPLSL